MLKRDEKMFAHDRQDAQHKLEWPISPITESTIDMLNRPETFYKSNQSSMVAASSPSTIQPRYRVIQPTNNQQSSLMSQNSRLSSKAISRLN